MNQSEETLVDVYSFCFEILAKGAEGSDNTTVTDPSIFFEHKDDGRGRCTGNARQVSGRDGISPWRRDGQPRLLISSQSLH